MTGPEFDEQGRPEPPVAGDETATLLGFLDYQRATLAWKCAGLDAAGLRATVGVLVDDPRRHAQAPGLVEDGWFSRCAARATSRRPPWDAVDWDADPDWEWRTAAEDTPEQLVALWQDAVARSRALVAEALADGGLEPAGAAHAGPTAGRPSLRWILVHMIEEYARHNGHADLLRESIDGATGE